MMPLVEWSPLDEMQRMDAARMAPLVRSGPLDADESRRDEPLPEDQDRVQYLPVGELRSQYIDYLQSKVDEIEEAKDARHYYHGAHWTPEQLKILRSRHQPPMTWNRTARKINGIVGVVERLRSDPKALPRTPKGESGAEIATQSVRYVLDASMFKSTDPWCLLQCSIDGIAGVQMVLARGDKGDPDVTLPWVIGDEYFYDPKSYRTDFSDVRYEGIAKWLDVEEAIELFPDKEDLLRAVIEGDSDLTTNADREYKWVIAATRRVRLVEHWYRHKGKWCWAFYVGNALIDQGQSPFYDEKGKSISSFIMFCAAVDHDGDRYGFVRNLKGPQDSLNQGKSKTLHIANSRRLIGTKGAVDDVEIARREWARPDGYVEINPGGTLTPDTTTMEFQAFTQFTEDAKAEMDGFGNINLAALNGAALSNISGRALEILRQPGLAELGPFILSYRDWKLRIYRNVWNTIQRYWSAERWIRVNNNDGLAQFIQLNGVGLDQFGRPVLVNAVGQVDVDIILEEGPDVASLMSATYDVMTQQPPMTFPPIVLIEASSLPRSEKDRLIKLMTPQPQPPNPMQETMARLAVEGMAADVAQKGAKVRDTHAAADQKLATAEEKRARIGSMRESTDLAAAEFSRDTLMQAWEATHPQQTQTGGQSS